MAEIGNQPLAESEYESFLTDMAPFLKLGESFYGAIVDAGLVKHKTAIYAKYAQKGDFAEKIDLWRSYPGKMANNILVKRLMLVDEKIKQGLPVSEEEMRDVRFFAEKHRSAQPYFVTRQEVAQVEKDDICRILDRLEAPETDYAKFAEDARLSQTKS